MCLSGCLPIDNGTFLSSFSFLHSFFPSPIKFFRELKPKHLNIVVHSFEGKRDCRKELSYGLGILFSRNGWSHSLCHLLYSQKVCGSFVGFIVVAAVSAAANLFACLPWLPTHFNTFSMSHVLA